MKHAPFIGVTPLYDKQRDSLWMVPGYLEGLQEAGGIPLILPLTSDVEALTQLLLHLDGLLLTGGQDVCPTLYGQPIRDTCGETCAARDQMEQALYRLALEKDLPVLGICRGIQLINVLHGGTLYQDLPAELPNSTVPHHMKPPYHRPVHTVSLVPGSPLAQLTGEEALSVNSYHHQGICHLGKGLLPMAYASDGLVEAVYAPAHRFVWAVQWHPEWIFQKDIPTKQLWRAFVLEAIEARNRD